MLEMNPHRGGAPRFPACTRNPNITEICTSVLEAGHHYWRYDVTFQFLKKGPSCNVPSGRPVVLLYPECKLKLQIYFCATYKMYSIVVKCAGHVEKCYQTPVYHIRVLNNRSVDSSHVTWTPVRLTYVMTLVFTQDLSVKMWDLKTNDLLLNQF